MSEPTVFIVEDDDAGRLSLECLLASVGYKTESYRSANEFLAAYQSERVGCLLLDVRLPHMSGIELLETLHKRELQIPTIVLTAFGNIPMAVKALKTGAIEFLEKPYDDQRVLDCIEQGLRISEQQSRERAEAKRAQSTINKLTLRQREILKLLVDCKSNKEIAGQLNISVRTVEHHRAEVLAAMNAKTRCEVVKMICTKGVTA